MQVHTQQILQIVYGLKKCKKEVPCTYYTCSDHADNVHHIPLSLFNRPSFCEYLCGIVITFRGSSRVSANVPYPCDFQFREVYIHIYRRQVTLHITEDTMKLNSRTFTLFIYWQFNR